MLTNLFTFSLLPYTMLSITNIQPEGHYQSMKPPFAFSSRHCAFALRYLNCPFRTDDKAHNPGGHHPSMKPSFAFPLPLSSLCAINCRFAAHCRPICRFSAITSTTRIPVSSTIHPIATTKHPHLIKTSSPATKNSALMTKNCKTHCRFAENKMRQVGNLNTVNKTPQPGGINPLSRTIIAHHILPQTFKQNEFSGTLPSDSESYKDNETATMKRILLNKMISTME